VKADAITEISLLGSPDPLRWSQNERGLTIQTPRERPCDYAYTFKITLKEPA
jgi:alpha-L-fucosidase